MRVYLGVVARLRGDAVAPDVRAAAWAALREAFPVPDTHLSCQEWVSEDAASALFAWTNEPDHSLVPPLLTTGPAGALGHCGHLGAPGDDDGARLLTVTRPSDAAGVVARLGGCFSVFRVGPDGLWAATTLSRVCPVYRAETARVYLVASRALLAHLVARWLETGRHTIEFDTLGLHAMVRHGFYTSDETPFRGVSALPNAAVLTLRRGHPPTVDSWLPDRRESRPTTLRRARELVQPLARALMTAASPLARSGAPVTLALTGGRDSRLVAATLRAAGVPFHAVTYGFPDDPDVVVARRVAHALRVAHRVVVPRLDVERRAVVVEHPLDRAERVVRWCEGMTSAYEDVDVYTAFTPTCRVSGAGGETLRGGFLYDQEDVSTPGIRRRLRTIFYAQDPLMTPQARARVRGHYAPWSELVEVDRFDVLDKLYLFFRTGRWLVGAHTSRLAAGLQIDPFLDNRVIGEAVALPPAWRWTEEALFLLIEQMAPQLRDLPIEGERWRFERDGPRTRRGARRWRHRHAVAAQAGLSGFNWRRQLGRELTAELRDLVLAAPAPLFDIVDRAAVEDLLRFPVGRPSQAWNLATVAVLLSGSWRRPSPTPRPEVAVPVSSSDPSARRPDPSS